MGVTKLNSLMMILMSLLVKEDKNSTNYQIARYILENATNLDEVSTESLAKGCNVSIASISRFCKYIGLEDFVTLKFMIKSFYPGKSVKEKYTFKQKYTDDVYNFLDEVDDCLHLLKDTINRSELDEITNDIYQYQRIILMGSMQSFGVAISLQSDLIAFNKFTIVCGEPSKQFEYLKNCTNKDLIIVFSASGEFFRYTMTKRNTMHRSNLPKIYMITVNNCEQLPYVYKYIQLHDKYNYSSNMLLNIYVGMIATNYKKLVANKSLYNTA